MEKMYNQLLIANLSGVQERKDSYTSTTLTLIMITALGVII